MGELVQDRLGDSGLRFFGRVTASVSHEIRNVLAVINENAGLIKDLMAMADKDGVVDPRRIDSLAGKVTEQIRRADGIIENMNRFAHSVDESYLRIDVAATLKLVADLWGRLAAARGVRLECLNTDGGVMITTSPFFLENLMALCLDFAVRTAGPEKTVLLSVKEGGEGVKVMFQGLDSLGKMNEVSFPSEGEKALMTVLGVGLELDADAGQCILSLPFTFGP